MVRNPLEPRAGVLWSTFAPLEHIHTDTERERLALTTASMVPLVGTVGLGGGGLMSTVAHHLGRHERLTVITTALDVAVELANAQGIELTVTAGETIPGTQNLVGPSALRTLRACRLDLAVVQADGVTEHGLSVDEPRVAETIAALMKRSAHVIVLAEAGAIGHRARALLPYPRCPTSLVAHTSADGSILDGLDHAGVWIARAG